MRKIVSLCFLTFLLLASAAAEAQISLDLMSLDSLGGRGIGIRGEGSCFVDDDFRLSLGLGYYRKRESDLSVQAMRVSIGADCFLLEESGLYVGVNLVDISYLWGLDAPDENPILVTQIRLGYLFRAKERLSLDLRLMLNDPVLTSESDSDFLKRCFSQYARYYLGIIVSYRFDIWKRKAPRRELMIQ